MISGTLNKVIDFKLADLPVGKALLILAAIGVGKGVTDIVYSKWPTMAKYSGLIGGAGLALAVTKVKAIKGFLGNRGAETLAIGGMAAAITSFYDIQGRIETYLATAAVPFGPVTAQPTLPPVTTAGATTGASTGATTGQVYESDVARRLAAIRKAQVARL